MLLREAAGFEVTLTSWTLLRLAAGLTSGFTAETFVILVDTTDVKELDTDVPFGSPWLVPTEVFNGLLVVPKLGEYVVNAFSDLVLDGNCAETVTAGCWLTATALVTGADIFAACVTTTPVDVAATAGLVDAIVELPATLLVTAVGFAECSDAVVIGELFVAVVTTLLPSMVLLPRLAPGLKSLELLTIVAKLGKGPCSTAMFVGTL